VIGVLVNYSNKFATANYGENLIDSGRSVMFAYVGIATGDLIIGYVSQYFKSRNKSLVVILPIEYCRNGFILQCIE